MSRDAPTPEDLEESASDLIFRRGGGRDVETKDGVEEVTRAPIFSQKRISVTSISKGFEKLTEGQI
jgi:hypothetical protein